MKVTFHKIIIKIIELLFAQHMSNQKTENNAYTADNSINQNGNDQRHQYQTKANHQNITSEQETHAIIFQHDGHIKQITDVPL